jgi:hypothetical protein
MANAESMTDNTPLGYWAADIFADAVRDGTAVLDDTEWSGVSALSYARSRRSGAPGVRWLTPPMASPDDLAHVMEVAQKIAKASVEVFGADGVTIQQFNESAGGQVVFHLHVHVIPRKAGVALKPPASLKEAPELLADQAKQLAATLR